MNMEEQLINLCRDQGSRVTILGSDPEAVKYYEVLFSRQFFAVVRHTSDIPEHYDTMIVLDADVVHYCPKLAHQWSTFIYLGSHEDDLINEDFMTAERYVWDNDHFRFIGKCSERIEQHVRPYVFEGWPELLPYADDIYVLYAGASEDVTISCRRFSCIIEECREAFANGYTKIFFYNGDESAIPGSISKCQRVADFLRYEVPENTFFYVNACQEIETVYNRLYEKHGYYNRMIPMGYFRFELQARDYIKSVDVKDLLERPYTPKTRENKFLFYNRVPRPHRQLLLTLMYGRDLIKHGLCSFEQEEHDLFNFNAFMHDHSSFENVSDDEKHQLATDMEHIHNNMLPMILNRSAERDNPVEVRPEDLEHHDSSYFSLVTETICFKSSNDTVAFSYDGVFYSEKIYKPIAAKQPFILASSAHALSELRNIGYKTFHPYIDETYDDVEDDVTRMKMIVDEVERLCNLSDEDWYDMQLALKPIIEHNYAWLLNEEKSIAVTKNIINYF